MKKKAKTKLILAKETLPPLDLKAVTAGKDAPPTTSPTISNCLKAERVQ